MSQLANEILKRQQVFSLAKHRAPWHVTIPTAVFQSIDHPSSQTRGDFVFFLLWWNVYMDTCLLSLWSVLAVLWSRKKKKCQCLSAKTALSCLCKQKKKKKQESFLFCFFQNMSDYFLFVCWKLVLDTRLYLGCFDVLPCSLYVIFMVKHIHKSTEVLSSWTVGVSEK